MGASTNGTVDDNSDLQFDYFVGSLISVSFDLLTFIMFASIPKLRKHPAELFVWRVLCTMTIDILYIISYASDATHDSGDNTLCVALAFVNQFASSAGDLWYLTLSIDLMIALRSPFSFHHEFYRIYHICVWGISFVISLVPLPFWENKYGVDLNLVCWIKDDSQNGGSSFSYYLMGMYYVPLAIIIFYSLYVLFKAHRAFGLGLPDTRATRTRVLQQSRFYVRVISSYLSLMLVLWVAQVSYSETENGKNVPMTYIYMVARSARGLVDFTAWFFNNNMACREILRCFGRVQRKRRCQRGLSTLNSRSTELRTPFLGDESMLDLGLGQAAIDDKSTSDADDADTPEETVNAALRREVMLCTTWGIADSLQHVSTPISSASSGSVRSRRIHLPFHFADKSFEFVDYDHTAFRDLRELCNINDTDYLRSFTINSDGEYASMLEKFTEGRSGSFFYFTHDYKYIVKTVTNTERKLLQNILPSYVQHLTQNPASLLTRFVGLYAIKMAPEQKNIYFVVMQNVFAARGAGELKLHEVYDLKGSTVQRQSLRPGQLPGEFKGTLKDMDLTRRIVVGTQVKAALSAQLVSDVTFLNSIDIMDYSLLVGVHDCNTDQVCDHAVISQRDTTTLMPSEYLHGGLPSHRDSICIPFDSVDASGPESLPRANIDGSHASEGADAAFMSSSDGRGLERRGTVGTLHDSGSVYFIGIIDMLQLYDMNKRLERFFKTRLRCLDGDGVSVTNPDHYSARFLDRILRHFE